MPVHEDESEVDKNTLGTRTRNPVTGLNPHAFVALRAMVSAAVGVRMTVAAVDVAFFDSVMDTPGLMAVMTEPSAIGAETAL